jgi:hypothetical protein
MIDNVTISQYVGQSESLEEDNGVVVYPNPTKESLNVQISEDADIEKVELVNHLGQVVYSQTVSGNSKLEIRRENNWVNGMYYLRLNGQQQITTRKIIFF